MFSCEYGGKRKITCFEEHLRKAASIICYFDTINVNQPGFCTTYSFKTVSEQKYKHILKNHDSQKNQINIYIYIYMYYYEIPWFYRDLKSENLCFLNLYVVLAGRILALSLEVMLSHPKWGTKHLYNSKGFSIVL